VPPAPPGIVLPTRDNRVRAGSGRNGGILDRDAFPAGDPSVISGAPSATTFPLLVWEGWLGGDTQVLVNPSVWEYDGDLSAYNEWQQLMINTHPTKSARPGSGSSALEPLTERDTRKKDNEDADRERREREAQDQLQDSLRQQLRVEAVIIRGGQAIDDVGDDRPDPYETPDATAMQMIPIQTAPSRDRYIGTISRTPALRLSSWTPAAARGLAFKDEQFTIADGRAVPLRGDYQIYIAIAPVP
jgi:hypothetical protein